MTMPASMPLAADVAAVRRDGGRAMSTACSTRQLPFGHNAIQFSIKSLPERAIPQGDTR